MIFICFYSTSATLSNALNLAFPFGVPASPELITNIDLNVPFILFLDIVLLTFLTISYNNS